MENKKKGGGTPRDCESLRIFVPDKARRQRVTVHGKYEQGNQFEMYFEKELTSLKERLPQFQKRPSVLANLRESMLSEENQEKSEDNAVANLGSYIAKPWIEKYRPSKAYELLAPEYQVRQILMWLKSWDEQINKIRKTNGLKTAQKKQDFGFNKVMLLSGATGIGKSTIAALTTKQIGFKSTVMTPSTARTSERMVQMVKNTTQTHRIDPTSGMIQKGVLIIDELDTASEGEVKSLTKALFSTGKLKRPVICIATNAFLPSLKEIREKSNWVHIVENSQQKLLTFLKGVCKTELIFVDQIYLQDIMNYLEGDIRLCLEALQQLYQRGRRMQGGGVKLTYSDIEAMDFEKVRDKFSTPHSLLKGIMLRPASHSTNNQLKIRDIDSQLGSIGEVSRISEGLHTNLFLESKSVFHGIELISSFMVEIRLCLGPFVRIFFFTRGSVLLNAAFCEGKSFNNFETPVYDYYYNFNKGKATAKLDRKRLYFEFKAEQAGSESVVQNFNNALSQQEFVEEVAPELMKALQPSLRFASTHLFNEIEHQEMNQVVSLMRRYKVQLNPQAKLGREDDPTHQADRPIWRPALHKLVSFVSSDSHNITLTNNERKLILFDYPLVMEREEKKKKKEEAFSEIKKNRPVLKKMEKEESKDQKVFSFEWIEGNHQILREKKANALFKKPVFTRSVLDCILPLRRNQF